LQKDEQEGLALLELLRIGLLLWKVQPKTNIAPQVDWANLLLRDSLQPRKIRVLWPN